MEKEKIIETCPVCNGKGYVVKKPTNFQRITESPEALAEFIAKSINETIKLTNGNRKYIGLVVQKEHWLKWLKQEAEP